MTKSRSGLAVVFSLYLAGLLCGPAALHADEGMWLFNALPLDYLESKHGFRPDDGWAEHLMKASVRFNSGGSASFISSQGLVLTNHHVGAETLHKLSTAEHNYYQDGFYARNLADEIPAPDLELNQLMSIEDVTARVNAAVKPSMDAAAAGAARRAVIAEIEKESLERTQLRSDVVTLYGGGRYHLYRYKKYTDVRLVWSPEAAIAFFGGDADNFEYPRYCLDACIFRVYENGKPAQIKHYLKWSSNGPAEDELVFVSGNPGRTSRIFTHAALSYQRDVRMPFVLNFIRRREILLQQFGLRGTEQTRQAKDELFGMQNSRKAYTGMLQGLQDPAFMAQKRDAEEQLIAKLKADEKLASYAQAFDQIADVQEELRSLAGQSIMLNTAIFNIAQQLVRLAAEDPLPNGERLPAFRDSNRASLLQQLYSPAPIYPELEEAKLADLLALNIERRGADDPLIKAMLAGKSPQVRAAELIAGTQLFEVDRRKQLAEQGNAGIEISQDPLIQLARLVDPESRRMTKITDQLQERERQAYAQITEASFATQGTSTYPDATFTLRLSFGPVKGYQEGERTIPAWTTLGGAFESEQAHGKQDAWQLPATWHGRREAMDLETPFNFVCTADIIGGNSGSPVVNKDLELVGLIFDGNIQSLTADYQYSDTIGRAVSVHSNAIREALSKIYQADRIVRELGE